MNINDILHSRLLRKSNINTNSYHEYIREIYLKEAINITNLHPELYLIDSNNLETFWVDSGGDGCIVLDLHLLDLLHYYAMLSFSQYSTKVVNEHLCATFCSYTLSNFYLVCGNVLESYSCLKKYYRGLVLGNFKLNSLEQKMQNEIQLSRGVFIHFLLLHEFAHLQYRKNSRIVNLLESINDKVKRFNNYADLVNSRDLSKIEQLLIKHKETDRNGQLNNFLCEFDKLFNKNGDIDKNERQIIEACAVNYFHGTKLDLILNDDIIEESYCDLFAILTILSEFHFTYDYLEIDNVDLIIKSVLCAITSIDIINSIRAGKVLNQTDNTLLKKEIILPCILDYVDFYCYSGKWKRDPKPIRKHLYEFSSFNELLYRVSIEYLIFLEENEPKQNNDPDLFSKEWYKVKNLVVEKLVLPFDY